VHCCDSHLHCAAKEGDCVTTLGQLTHPAPSEQTHPHISRYTPRCHSVVLWTPCSGVEWGVYECGGPTHDERRRAIKSHECRLSDAARACVGACTQYNVDIRRHDGDISIRPLLVLLDHHLPKAVLGIGIRQVRVVEQSLAQHLDQSVHLCPSHNASSELW
jgi:hypothetical protein